MSTPRAGFPSLRAYHPKYLRDLSDRRVLCFADLNLDDHTATA